MKIIKPLVMVIVLLSLFVLVSSNSPKEFRKGVYFSHDKEGAMDFVMYFNSDSSILQGHINQNRVSLGRWQQCKDTIKTYDSLLYKYNRDKWELEADYDTLPVNSIFLPNFYLNILDDTTLVCEKYKYVFEWCSDSIDVLYNFIKNEDEDDAPYIHYDYASPEDMKGTKKRQKPRIIFR